MKRFSQDGIAFSPGAVESISPGVNDVTIRLTSGDEHVVSFFGNDVDRVHIWIRDPWWPYPEHDIDAETAILRRRY